MLKLTLEFEIEEDDLQTFIAENGGDLNEWVFAEICQNQGLGFLVGCRTEKLKGR